MPTPIEQLLSRTVYDTDGTNTIWDFSFADGYLDPSHVKAYTTDSIGLRTDIVVTPLMLIGEFQLQITPALADDLVLTIYRDTPKNAPLVNFADESGFSEIALDTNARQSIMVAAEAIDTVNALDVSAAIEAAEDAASSAAAAAASAASIGTSVVDAEAAADAAIAAQVAAEAAAAVFDPSDFATAAQGATADSAVQPADLTSANIVDATAIGRAILTALDAAAVRVALAFTTFGSNFVQAVDAAAGRTLLALGSLATKSTVATADLDNAAVTAGKLSGAQAGSAPAIACRAVGYADGTLTGTNAPTYGNNVASVQRTVAGNYMVNFATAMPHADYAVVFGGLNTSGTNVNYLVLKNGGVKTTSQFEFVSVSGDRTVFQDNIKLSFAVFA